MKKFLLALLVATAISPAMAKDGPYKMANPLYRPSANKYVVGAEASYAMVPKKETIGQDKTTIYALEPNVVYGITDKLALDASVSYGKAKIKSGAFKGDKASLYSANVGLSYLIASADNFDFNVNAGLFYDKTRVNRAAGNNSRRHSGVDVGLTVGKKIENITPYFAIGFQSDFWSSRGGRTGTETYINPGVYIDLNKKLALDLNYTSVTHGDATYRAILDFYAKDNVVVGFGAFVVHPETDTNEYGGLVNVKVGF